MNGGRVGVAPLTPANASAAATLSSAVTAISREKAWGGREGFKARLIVMGKGDLVPQYSNFNEPSTNDPFQSLKRPVSIQRSTGFNGRIQTMPATR